MRAQSLGKLNQAQQQAVTLEAPIISIIAGPGTGKTTTLLHRLIYLVEQRAIDPTTVATLTFTKKAAGELNERLASLVSWSHKPFIGTFHGFAHQMLQQAGRETSLISEPQRLRLIKEINTQRDLTDRELSLYISRYKTSIFENENLGQREKISEVDRYIQKLTKSYQESLQEIGKLDFDDLLLEWYRQLLNQTSTSFSTFLVDEFQDTSPLQYALLRRLLKMNSTDSSLCVIGDPRQSIYAFRGASDKVFDVLKNDYPQVIAVSLTDNYRSAPIIIDTASRLFPQASPLYAVQKQVGSVTLLKTPTEWTEAAWVLQQIGQLMGGLDLTSASDVVTVTDGSQARFSDFAIIFRSHRLAHTLEKMFEDTGIPYQVVGGTSLYEKKEVQFLLLTLRYLFLVEQTTKTKEKSQQVQDTFELLSALAINKPEKIRSLPKLFEKVSTVPVSKLIIEIIQSCNLEKIFAENPRALKNIITFQSQLVRFDESVSSVGDCLAYFENLSQQDYYDPTADRVTLLTMHAAKGLEFDYVFVCGFEDGLIPHQRSFDDGLALAEERRLLYVALTRARRQLYLTVTQQRFGKPTAISRFWSEIIHAGIVEQSDPAIAKLERKKIQQQKKKQQLGLFG